MERRLTLAPDMTPNPLAEAQTALMKGASVLLALQATPDVKSLVKLARTAHHEKQHVVLGFLEQSHSARAMREFACDLGITCVEDMGALVAAAALLMAGAQRPWTASLRMLNSLDRAKLHPLIDTIDAKSGAFGSESNFYVSWRATEHHPWHVIGSRTQVAEALRALRAANPYEPPDLLGLPPPKDVDHHAVQQVLFGPARALSDPASKAVLRPYGVPCPEEELCSSSSRTASEATRMGFPVRIALASPDLRAWDHPDLVVDAVDNASRARQVFQHVMELAKERAPQARLLGVTVSLTRAERALLRIRITPAPHGLVLLQVGFADPHGMAAGDVTMSYLPISKERFEPMLSRLKGHQLLFESNHDGRGRARYSGTEMLYEVLHRLGTFVNYQRKEVDSVELNPLVVLLDGSVEIREACVTVTDAFSRALSEASG